MAYIVRWLIKRLKTLKIRIRRVFLDKGFCSNSAFKVLDRHKLSYMMPIPVRDKSGGVRSLFQGKSRKTSYTFHSPKHGEYTAQAVVVKRYLKGGYGRHKSKWFAYAVTGLPVGLVFVFTFLCAKICRPRSNNRYTCQNDSGYHCAAWHSCSVAQYKDCVASCDCGHSTTTLYYAFVKY